MNITEELIIEHQLILTINRQMLALAYNNDWLPSDQFFEFATQYATFIQDFVDNYHHNKEEEFLFEALQLPGVLDTEEMIADMLGEHQLGRDALDLILHGIKYSDFGEVSHGISTYASVMAEHIATEETVLFPLAEKHLAESVKRRIKDFYNDVEDCRRKHCLWDLYTEFSEDLLLLPLSQKCTLH